MDALGTHPLGVLPLGGTGGGLIPIGLAEETDSALALQTEFPLSFAVEVDEALALRPVRTKAIGLATETDSALAVTSFKHIGLPTETDVALAFATRLGLATETDTALSIRAGRSRAIGLAEETDSALGMTLVMGHSEIIGIATETDTALALLIHNLGLAEEIDEALGILSFVTDYWPFDDLPPRHIGIHPCAAPIGGGASIAGKEPTKESGNGYWRIVYGGVYVKDRDRVLRYREMAAKFEGRGRAVIIYIYDGKRAPWPGTPGGSLAASANAAVAQGATSIQIDGTGLAALQVGMGFSTAQHRYHRIKAITGTVGNVYTCTIFPPTRDAIASGAALEFGRPTLLVRLQDDDGMNWPLHLLKTSDGTVAFVEDVP